MTKLGILYEHGKGVPLSYENAAAWFEKAAEQGQIAAMMRLGFLYQKGQGVPQSDERAAQLFSQCSAKKDATGHLFYLAVSRRP